MATLKHLEILRNGTDAWNEWRSGTGVETPDLEGADLSVDAVGRLALEGVNLAGAKLNRASLRGQRLGRADLQNAQMEAANLRSVDLNGANLRRAALRHAELQPQLVPFTEDLSNDPAGAMHSLVEEVRSEGGDFSIVERGETTSTYSLPDPFIVRGRRMGEPSTLKSANMDGADLGHANLLRADLTGATMRHADLEGANLEEAILKGAVLTGANMHSLRLISLQLSGSDLPDVPIEITRISSLVTLNLSGNRIEKLPPELGQLSNLETLDLRNNRLRKLPAELATLSKLRRLYLHGNADLGIPPEILGEEPSWSSYAPPNAAGTILDYYRRTLAGRRPLNEAKLILVGFGGVGKTSIVNRLVSRSFDPRQRKTEGISIDQWRVLVSGNEEVKLNIWDFGGQEIMHATHQFFLTERSVYLLVLNGRQGREEGDAEYWLRLIDSFGKNSPVIVVLNKIREHHFDLNRGALQQKFPSIRAFIQTDCEDGTGLVDLTRAIERETDALEHLRDVFPEHWFKIKESLSQSRHNYLPLAEYRALCVQHGEVDTNAQDALAVHLHALGVALNYREDPRLREMNILNPHWVTNGIYAILNSDMLAMQNGMIRLDQLTSILDRGEYPEGTHAFLCDLMKKFELCFDTAEAEYAYLVPDLLDRQEPAEAATFVPQECLNFEYEYPILPEGLLPRFIVRTHVLSTTQRRWRTGVILTFDQNRALIKADLQDRRVSIRVAGPKDHRRGLLAIIRSDFERIHNGFKFEVLEKVPLPEHPGIRVGYRDLLVMEQNGLATYPLVAGAAVLMLDVKLLLHSVEVGPDRRRGAPSPGGERRLRLFYSYSHRDEKLRRELETHLKLMQREGLIEPWHDRQITAGQEWNDEIGAGLEEAEIIVLLVSSDFIASDFAYGTEMTRALERHQSGTARVIPVIVRDVDWRTAPFGKLQALPKDGKPVTKWSSRDSAWRDVSSGIRRTIEELRARKRPSP